MSKRALTKGEVELCQSVFKDSIDYNKVHIHNKGHNPFQKSTVSMAPYGELYCIDNYRDDFSTCNNHMQAHFIHEMTHIWQYQNNVLHPVVSAIKETVKHKFDFAKAYPYNLKEHSDLIDYGLEQQACIVQNMFKLKIDECYDICMTKKGYDKVLKNFFQDPSYARRPNLLQRTFGKIYNYKK